MRGCRAALLAGALSALTHAAFAYNDTQPAATVTDEVNKEFLVATATTTQTASTAFIVATGLSQNLTAGKTYSCSGHLSTSVSSATYGIAIQLIGTNSLSATSASFTGFAWNGTTAESKTTVTALATNIVGIAALVTDVYINGAIVVNAGGTINVEVAEDVSHSGATAAVLINSTFGCVRVN